MKNLEYKYRWRLTVVAREEIRQIYEYIARVLQEPQIARRLTKDIIKEINLLKTSPYLGQRVKVKPRNEEYRRLVIRNYIVLYKVEEIQKEILIFHIFYGKRDYLEFNN